MTDAPIQKELAEMMNNLAHAIDGIVNPERTIMACAKPGDPEPKKWGFALLVFPFGEKPDARMNYISNAGRGDVVAAMREFIARQEMHESNARHGPTRTFMHQYVIYGPNNVEHPGEFVLRKWEIRTDGHMTTPHLYMAKAATLADIRLAVHTMGGPGLACISRHPTDDPCIVETWL